MFQIGFWECVLVGVVALWAFGPDKLPVLARLAGRFFTRAKHTLISLKNEFDLASGHDNTKPPSE